MKKVLVTGNKGFVGSHFWNHLDDERHELWGIDIKGRHHPAQRSFRKDARDFFRQDNTHYDLVIHCAAIVGGRQTIEGSPLKVAVDLAIDAELWQWALRTKPGRIVYFSSSAAYPVELQTGDPPRRLWESAIDLYDIHHPDQTYGLAKLVGEVQARCVEDEGIRVHVMRPFSGYGVGQDLSYPWPMFIDRARNRRDPFDIWGTGQQVRDWIHISDIVGATMACIEQDVPGPVNLCTGRATTFDELAHICCDAAGYSPTLRHMEGAPTGVAYRVGDPTKMLTVYQPKIRLEDAVREALA